MRHIINYALKAAFIQICPFIRIITIMRYFAHSYKMILFNHFQAGINRLRY